MRFLRSGAWEGQIRQTQIDIGRFNYAPSESSKITNLLGIAGSMAGLKALPPSIEDTPIVVEFGEDGNHILFKVNAPDGLVPFTFEQVDELIQAINAFTGIAVDMQKISPAIPRGGFGPEPPDIIEGR